MEDLEVFKRSHQLALKIHRISEAFPIAERFNLIPQMRRAASSIGTNLMEGGHRLGRKEFRQFCGIAKGSAGELKYHVLITKNLGYLSETNYSECRSEIEG